MTGAPLMVFTRPPHINWGPLPSPRWRRNWCGLCRYEVYAFFDVPDSVWLHYVGKEQRHQIVCIGCWHWLTDIIDNSRYEQERGGPVPLWSDQWRVRHGIPPDKPRPVPADKLLWFTIATADAHP